MNECQFCYLPEYLPRLYLCEKHWDIVSEVLSEAGKLASAVGLDDGPETETFVSTYLTRVLKNLIFPVKGKITAHQLSHLSVKAIQVIE